MKNALKNIPLPEWVYSIRTKLAVVTSLIIALISVFIYWFFPARLEQQALAALGEKAATIATMMAYNIGPAIQADDRPVVCDIVLSAKQNRDLDYAMVLNEKGEAIASFDSNKAIALDYSDVDFKERISSDGMTYQTVAPIITHSSVYGRVYLGISLKPLLGEVEKSRRTIAWVSFIIGGLGMVLMVVFSALITTPLVKVVNAAEKVSSGDWKQRARVDSRDEVGHLATAFNAMVENLESAYDDLRKSEKNYRDLFASNPHPMWVFDLESVKFIDANDAAIENYGYTRDEFLSMTIHDIVLENTPEKMQQLLTRQGNLYRSTGWRHLKRDGSTIDVEMSSHTLPLRGGRRARLVLANDITKRLRAEAMVRESEERYRDLFESASDLILSVGPDCRFLFVNRACTETLGFTEAEAAGMTIFDIVKKSELPQLRVHFRDALNGKRLNRIQTVFIAKNGNEVVVEGSLSTKFEKREAVSTRGIFRDVTERKRAEAAILLQKTRFEQLFENAPIGIALADAGEHIVNANRTFVTMFGYSNDELKDKSLVEAIIPSGAKRESAILMEQLIQGKPVQASTTRQRKDGSTIPVDLYGVPIIVNNQAHGIFGMYVDITERKEAEEKRAQLMQELESINKELNDFAYIVSHDLKAPLRAIGSLVNWLTTDYGEKLGEEGNEMLKMLLGRTTRMHDLIDGVLKYSRLGRQKDELTTIELDNIVPDVVDLISPPSHVEVKIQRPLPMIMGESTRVQQVFQNILSNAIKFMDKPKGLIEIGCVRENGLWKFSIADNGQGIEERHFTKIFQIFQTLSARDSYESTGIGLTIVKKIVEMHGGKIWLESKVGEGTTFFFTFPVRREDMAHGQARQVENGDERGGRGINLLSPESLNGIGEHSTDAREGHS
jgi:PAS domain S-box-containing protein